MKIKILRHLFLTAVLVLSIAHVASAQPGSSATTAATKEALYEKFVAAYKGDAEQQKIAYETGREYLSKYSAAADAYTDFIKKWNAKYEKNVLEFNFRQSVSQKKHADAFRHGKEILAAEPERLDVLIWLSSIGYGDQSGVFDAETNAYALRAMKLIEAGNQPKTMDRTGKMVVGWTIFGDRETVVGTLNLVLGNFALKAKKASQAAAHFHAATSVTVYAKDPTTYFYLAEAYRTGISTIDEEFAQAKAMPQTNEAEAKAKLAKMDAVREKQHKIMDSVVDALARAVALATDPKLALQKESAMKTLTMIYKLRHNDSVANLQAYIDQILSQPLPSPIF